MAHLVEGTVMGPDGPMANTSVGIFRHDLGWTEVFTDGSGHYQIDYPADSIDFIGPNLPEESEFIGEYIRGIDITGGREIRLFAADKVTISGEFEVPPGFDGQLGFGFSRQDKNTTLFDWSVNGLNEFEATVPAGVYVITAAGKCRFSPILGSSYCPATEYFSYLPIDASEGSVGGLVVPVQDPQAPLIPTMPPIGQLISVGPPDEGGTAMVTGLLGAAAGPASITLVNLQTGHYTTGASKEDGSFDIPFLAPPGSYLEVRQDPTTLSSGASTGAGTIIRVPVGGNPSVAFATLARANEFSGSQDVDRIIENIGISDSGQVWVSGDMADRDWMPGETLMLSGDLKVYSRNAASLDLMSVFPYGRIMLERVFDTNGAQERADPVFMSRFLTPTGLPIERRGFSYNRGSTYGVKVGEMMISGLSLAHPHRLEATWESSIELPADLPEGIYSVSVEAFAGDISAPELHFEGVYSEIFDTPLSRQGAFLVRIGSPAPGRLSWVLGLNDFSNGTRGTIALVDRNRLGIAGRVTTNSRSMILPREDPRTGLPIQYPLEPFVPLLGTANRGWMPPPTVPFSYPSGQLDVSIGRPDGLVDNLPPASFMGSYVQTPIIDGPFTNDAGNHPSQYFGLTTLEPQFDVSFEKYGPHTVSMTGTIDDETGESYAAGGTYEILVARRLDIETGVFPNTPFEVGDYFAPTVIVQPGVEADITIEINHYPQSDPAQLVGATIEGTANRFGYFQPPADQFFQFTQPGEYRVDVQAEYRDSQGGWWAGEETWASVVETPGSPLVAHGARNFNCTDDVREQWVIAGPDNICGTHLPFPFHRGDIAWSRDTDIDPFFTAMFPTVTVQDTEGTFADIVRARNTAHFNWFGDIEDLISIGQIPLFSSTTTGIPGPLVPQRADTHLGYFYSGAARPGVRVRDMVSEAENQESYWRFDNRYYDQPGVGLNGDETNDFKFQFGGAVYRAPDMDFYYYGAYGSLWVLLPDDDPTGTRVMPPFQGNAGGPSGGPIMTLLGEEIDIFFHPTGVRPGSILEVGEIAAFAGQIGPTLPSQVHLTVQSPTGVVTQISGQANKVGYFYDPSTNLVVDEPGNWNVSVTVTHDGQTSAGPTQEPFPSGSILGTMGGNFHFYVVEADSPALEIVGPEDSWVQPGLGPIGFDIQPPEGWTDLTVHRMTTMPGFQMEDRTLADLHYDYNAPALAVDFPNLDLEDFDGHYGVDTITISFLLEGTDEFAQKAYRARQCLLQGEELHCPPQYFDRRILIHNFE